MKIYLNFFEGMNRFTHRLGAALNWSALSNIGNSSIARLTILMPIIGYLLIFNTTFLSYLDISLLDRDVQAPSDLLTYLYSKNMKFLYFGLLVFGIGVAIYNIFVPFQIKKHPFVEEYIHTMEKIKTKNLIIGSFDGILAMYQKNFIGDAGIEDSYIKEKIGFPINVRADFNRLVGEMFIEIEVADWGEDENGDLKRSRFWTGTGNLLTEDVIEMMCSGRTVDRQLIHMMYENIDDKSKDIFYIEHKALEYSRTTLRFITFMLYGFGLGLTAIPTILTSLIIIRDW